MSWTTKRLPLLCCVAVLMSLRAGAASVSSAQQQCLAKAHRFERHGWIHLHVEGGPKERGFQHGYLLAAEIAEGLRSTRNSWEYQSGMSWSWLVEHGAAMFTPHIDAENLEELEAMAEGM